MRNLYQILNVAQTCTELEIKRAFRKLALHYHPDRNPSAEAAKLFQEVVQAYDILSNSSLRARYDAQLRYKSNSFTPIPKNYSTQAPEKTEAYYKKYGTIGKFRRNNPNYVVPEMGEEQYSCLSIFFICVAMIIALPIFIFFAVQVMGALSELEPAIQSLLSILFWGGIAVYVLYISYIKE
ncbi:MAG: J domain-containing protein [Bacteroidia bacterium]